MKAVKWYGAYDVRVEETSDPELKTEKDAIIRPTLATICGTDLHIYRGELTIVPGGTIGHEFMGTVEKVGKEVKNFREGDKVIVSAWIADGECWFCRQRLYTQCSSINIFGMGPVYGESLDGAFAELVRVPNADVVLIKAPEDIPDEKLVLASDGLATAYDAVLNGGVKAGDTVAVVGCGPIGLMSCMCADVIGASQVIAVDISKERLEVAKSLGFTAVNASETDAAEEVRELTDGRGADVVIEAVGRSSEPLLMAVEMARRKGTISVVGFHIHEYNIPMGQLWLSEKRLVFSIGDPIRNGEALINLIKHGKIDPSKLITHKIRIEEAPRGFELFEKRQALKVAIDFR